MRALALATLIAAVAAGGASAEAWQKYVDGANGTQWSIDNDYTYKDRATGRLVVMQAISKPEAKLGPSPPGKADGVGNVVAIDCSKKNLIMMGSYKPSQALDIKGQWRSDTPKKVGGPDDEALVAAACATASNAPVK